MSDRGEALADHVGLLVARVKELEAQLAAEKNAREEAEKLVRRLDNGVTWNFFGQKERDLFEAARAALRRLRSP